jgi:hypothetical protein
MLILADVVFTPVRAPKIEGERAAAQYRWHGTNQELMPGFQPLVLDEWKTMQLSRPPRGQRTGAKLQAEGTLWRALQNKARRIRQHNQKYPMKSWPPGEKFRAAVVAGRAMRGSRA